MGALSRNKGSAFERDIAAALRDELGIKFERDLDQYRKADRGDLIADDPAFPFLIECKRRAEDNGELTSWRLQASTAAREARKIPAVVFSFDRRPVRVSVPMRAFCEAWPADMWAEITLPSLCFVAREIMADTGAAWRPNDYTDLHQRIVGNEAAPEGVTAPVEGLNPTAN